MFYAFPNNFLFVIINFLLKYLVSLYIYSPYLLKQINTNT